MTEFKSRLDTVPTITFFAHYRENPYKIVPEGWVVYCYPEDGKQLVGDKVWNSLPVERYADTQLAGVDPNGIMAAEYHLENIRVDGHIVRWVTEREVWAFLEWLYNRIETQPASSPDYDDATYLYMMYVAEWKEVHPIRFAGFYRHKSIWEEQ